MTDTPAGVTMFGHFAPVNDWTEINSSLEGRFLERIAPGAFDQSFADHASGKQAVRLLFDHGNDPQVGRKPLGRIEVLREDNHGGYFEARLLDADYALEVARGIREGLYGVSFGFRVLAEDVVRNPGRSPHNPFGLQERTVTRMRLNEVSPVTFPAYAATDVGLRAGAPSTTTYTAAAPATKRTRRVAGLWTGSSTPRLWTGAPTATGLYRPKRIGGTA